MPVGFLVSVGLAAFGTVCALAPPRWPRWLWPVAFRVGVLFSELPFVALFLLVASTALAFAEGDVHGVAGWAGVGLAVMTAAGLGVVVRRAARGRAGIPWVRILFTPLAVRRRGVERVADIRYGDAGRRHLLDVYRPRVPNGRVLVYWHGGGYFSGRKNREARLLLYRLAEQGWVCVSANYRLRPKADLDDHLEDARSVIAWVRAHGHEYGADPERLVLAGSSAGGHLASMCALTDPGVAAVVSFYGYYGNYYGTTRGPLNHLHPDAPPFFLAHGDRDSYAPVEQARDFAGRLRQASGNPVVYLELPGGHHAFDLYNSIRFDTVVRAAMEFLEAQMSLASNAFCSAGTS